MKQSIIGRFSILVALFLISQGAVALDLKVGKWSFTSTTAMPMMAPMVETTEECIEEGYDALAEIKNGLVEGGMQCDVSITVDTATELNGALSCEILGAGSMDGTLKFVAQGDTASSSLLMSMDMGGQALNISSESTARYIGAFD